MTPSEETDVTDVTEPAEDAPKDRQAVGLWIGAGIGLLVVAAILFVTLASGQSSDDGATATTVPTTVAGSVPEQLKKPIKTPKGDYTAYCKELIAQAPPISGDLTPSTMAQLVKAMDFQKLIAVAPEGLRPDLQVLQDSQQDVITVMGQVASLSDLTEADFPEGFYDAAITVGHASTEKCA